MNRFSWFLAILSCSLAAAVLTGAEAATAAPQFKMGFIYSGPFTDFGYNYNQELSRIYLSNQLLSIGYNVTTELYENATFVEADAALHSMGTRRFDLVVMTTNFYNDLLNSSRLASYPFTKFVVQAMPGPANNSVGLASAGYTARFVAGAMCGSITKTNKIGFIGPFPFPFMINQINAFALGARKVNPKAEVVVVWIFSFLDPLLSAKAAEYLVNEHKIDCGAAQQDDDTPQKIWQKRKVPSTGANGDTRITAGNYVYFSQLEDSGVWYWRIVQSILNGTFDRDFSRSLIETRLGDGITLSSFSPLMSYETVNLVEEMTRSVANGSEKVFCGSTMSQEGFAVGNDGCMNGFDIAFMPRLFSFVANPLNMTIDLALTRLSVRPSSGLGIALFVITSILAAACFFFIFDISRYRDTEIIRTASPFFCILILVGFVISLMSVYGWADQPSFSMCQMRIWLSGIGFATVFGALLVKNFRILQIFRNESMEIFAITNKELVLQGVLPALLVEIIILAVWTGVDPYTATTTKSPLLEYDQVFEVCRSKASWGVGIFLAYKCLILAVAVVLSYQVRGVDVRYNESTLIGLSIYSTAIVAVVAIVVNVVVVYTLETEAAIIGFGILIVVGSMMALIFGPKSWSLHVLHETEHNTSPTSTITRGSTIKGRTSKMSSNGRSSSKNSDGKSSNKAWSGSDDRL